MLRILISDNVAEICATTLGDKGIEVEFSPGMAVDVLKQRIGDFDGLIVRSATKVTDEIIQSAANLKVIGRAGAGIDNIDLAAATEKGIAVFNAAAANTISAAEHTFALMLALARKIPQAHYSLACEKWNRNAFKGVELFEKTLGVIGLGKIGRELASRAKAFGMKIVAYDPLIPPELFRSVGAERLELNDLVRHSDFITMHVPLNSATKHLIGAEQLNLAKKGLLLINTSRGGIIDESALLTALTAGNIAGAALDVYEKEPPRGSPLLKLNNVVLTPHLGASTIEAQQRVALQIAETVADFLLESKAENILNPEAVCQKYS
ncbi:MAG: hydroxyacid dehydrogenase [bacterium]